MEYSVEWEKATSYKGFRDHQRVQPYRV